MAGGGVCSLSHDVSDHTEEAQSCSDCRERGGNQKMVTLSREGPVGQRRLAAPGDWIGHR